MVSTWFVARISRMKRQAGYCRCHDRCTQCTAASNAARTVQEQRDCSLGEHVPLRFVPDDCKRMRTPTAHRVHRIQQHDQTACAPSGNNTLPPPQVALSTRLSPAAYAPGPTAVAAWPPCPRSCSHPGLPPPVGCQLPQLHATVRCTRRCVYGRMPACAPAGCSLVR
jgi:hypothetical protein